MSTPPIDRLRKVYSGWAPPQHELDRLAEQDNAQKIQAQVDLEDLIAQKVAERLAQMQAETPKKGKPKLVEPTE